MGCDDRNTDGGDGCSAVCAPEPGESHHLAVVENRAAGSLRFYTDANFDVERTYRPTLSIALNAGQFADWNNEDRTFDGRLDDVRFYNALLDDAAIAYLASL